MDLASHLAELRRALEDAEVQARSAGGAGAEDAGAPALLIERAEIQTPAYLLPDAGAGIRVLPAGAGGPRARLRGLGRISVVFVPRTPGESNR